MKTETSDSALELTLYGMLESAEKLAMLKQHALGSNGVAMSGAYSCVSMLSVTVPRPASGLVRGFKEDSMRHPHVDDFVRLTTDIPELALSRGEVGVVRSTWFAPSVAYEVEFHQRGNQHETRALLLAEQVQVEEGAMYSQPVHS
jgi:hypothetical protein